MSKFFKGFAAAALAASALTAANAADFDGTASVEIVEAITVVSQESVDFGAVGSPSGSTGTVTITPSATTATFATSGVTQFGTASQGSFTITGAAGRNVQIAFLNGNEDITLASAANAFDAVTNPTGNADELDASLTLAEAGTQALDDGTDSDEHTFYVGGTLTIPDGAAQDAYSGTFTVDVRYE
ncbi:MAG: DUF4402 domain-containing protein [Pacificimonas sp.]|jgi:hypothetical protein|nr:DUF4402 domain-containing protein [Pacificimonas sp.]